MTRILKRMSRAVPNVGSESVLTAEDAERWIAVHSCGHSWSSGGGGRIASRMVLLIGATVVIVADIVTDFNIADVGTKPEKDFSETDVAMRTQRSWECVNFAWKRFLTCKKSYTARTGEWKIIYNERKGEWK